MSNKRIPFLSGKTYHVFNHGNADDNIFRTDSNYHRFLNNYTYHIAPIAHTFAYALLPNHFHFLLMFKTKKELIKHYREKYPSKTVETIYSTLPQLNSQQFSNFLNAYSKYFNLKNDRRGSLFLDNINRKLINHSKYFFLAFQYVQFNPLIHKLVKDINDYSYTSFHAYNSSKLSKINKKLAYKLFPRNESVKKIPRNDELEKYALEMNLIY